MAGRITAERFDLLAAEYELEQKELKVQIAELEDLIENGETKTKDFKQLLVNVRKYTDPQELTSELLKDLVDKIIVHALIRAVDIENKRLKFTTMLSASLICIPSKRMIASPYTADARVKR